DFVVDPNQVYHAKLMMADAVLLIVALYSEEQLRTLIQHATEAMVDALVEVHDESELDTAVSAGARIIGVNNRNLKDFTVSLEVSDRLVSQIPDSCVKVVESGIFTHDHIQRLKTVGYDAFLVGEALVTADNPVELLRSLRGVSE
ncbi:indole-3-glycerol-phosphate synthase TrpC, partial [candidate division GN15 bacterium]|nr:indole-3-glycerol-phosphate synthase TrpC [candidate division GN15 bacterium]